MLELNPDFAAALAPSEDLFESIMALEGDEFKKIDGRRTVRFCLNKQYYFMKAHSGVGWLEIAKNLVQLKAPVIGASNEWRGIQKLQDLNVATMTLVAYGQRGLNPAKQRSFVVTEALTDTISLEKLCSDWGQRKLNKTELRLKRALIAKVAEIARTLHDNGVNHRDFYLCHFLLQKATRASTTPLLYVIDLHRVQLRQQTPLRWRVKDVAGLYFSSMDIGLSRRDLYRFIRIYRNTSLRQSLHQDRGLWQAVSARAHKMYRKCLADSN